MVPRDSILVTVVPKFNLGTRVKDATQFPVSRLRIPVSSFTFPVIRFPFTLYRKIIIFLMSVKSPIRIE